MSEDKSVLEMLVGCGKSWAEERAKIALELTEQHEAGAISDEEFAELAHDLVRADKLDEEADDLEMKAMLVTAIYGVAQVI